MKPTTKINVNPTTELIVSHEIAFAKMDMTPVQMDVISLLLAEIGKETDIDEQRNYTLTADMFQKIKEYKTKHDVYEIMRERVTGRDRLSKVDMTIYRDEEDIEALPWFTSVRYFNGSLILHVNPDVKEMLVELKKGDKYKVFASLQYILPMKSTYSKRIYLMCRNYVTSGKIYNLDWGRFREMLEIPATYSDAKVITRALEKAKEEINRLSDLQISYKVSYEASKGRGGKKAASVSFAIARKNKKTLTDAQKKAIEMKAEGVQPEPQQAKPKKNAFNDFKQRDYDYDELERQLTGH